MDLYLNSHKIGFNPVTLLGSAVSLGLEIFNKPDPYLPITTG